MFKLTFADLATEYYVAARIAAMTFLMNIYGNLFHHAVELYLKAALVGTIPVERMKQRPYIHDLRELWREFKTKESDPALGRFDSTIAALHEFESIRYPDKRVDDGFNVTLAWKRGDVRELGPTTMSSLPKYEVVIEEVDHLIIEVLRRASLDPKAFTLGLRHHSVVRDALTYQNPEADNWALGTGTC
jgi:hypothetical protein